LGRAKARGRSEGRPPAMAEVNWEPTRFTEVIRSYASHSNKEVDRVRRNLLGLSDDDKAELTWKAEEQITKMEEAVKANLAFLEELSELIAKSPAPPSDGRPQFEAPHGTKPIQTLLQTFTREWSAEGLRERGECHDKLLGAVDSHLKAKKDEAVASGAAPPRVLVPGCSLGRLPFDLQGRGYKCSASEGRVLQYFGGELMRRTAGKREVHRIQPFAINTCNRFKKEDHVRETPVPEVEVLEGSLPEVHFGDFLRLYGRASDLAAYDAVVTAFTLDCSPNVLRFVRTVAHLIRPGGLWTNFGPLAYDTDHDEGHGHGIELSWEELRHAISHFFDVKEEEFVDSLQAANGESMMQIQYSCIFFTAVRNDKEAVGIGEK